MIKNHKVVERVARERIAILFQLAEKRTLMGDAESRRLAKKYTRMIRQISTHYKTPMPAELGRRICKKCGNVLVPGLDCKVRAVSAGRYMLYTCECGEEKRVFYEAKTPT